MAKNKLSRQETSKFIVLSFKTIRAKYVLIISLSQFSVVEIVFIILEVLDNSVSFFSFNWKYSVSEKLLAFYTTHCSFENLYVVLY